MALQQMSFGGVAAVSFCSRCNKPLTNPESVKAGMGPICRGHGGDMNDDACKREEFSDGPVVGEDDWLELSEALVLQRVYDDKIPVRTNVPHLVVHHSPSGFEFGYGGSGPADLALNICQWYLNRIKYQGVKSKCFDGACFSLAFVLHQDFKRDFIASAPNDGVVIPFGQIKLWFEVHITDDLKRMYEAITEEELE